MPMSVVYTTVNGQILCENRGGVVSHFVSDPLGSVVMVRDNSGNTVYEAEYDPYGNVQSETGTNPSEFGYVGTLGYVKDSAFSLYVRARYLLTNLGRWLTKDPLWPSEPGFVYAGAAPSMWGDASGLGLCEYARDQCLAKADKIFQECVSGIWKAIEDLKRRLCNGLRGIARDLCVKEIFDRMNPLFSLCASLVAPLYAKCGKDYLYCLAHGWLPVIACLVGLIVLVIICDAMPLFCAVLIPPILVRPTPALPMLGAIT